MQQLYSSPLILSGLEKQAFLKEIDPDDSTSPKIVFVNGNREEVSRSPDPLPRLILKDRSGAFADLWMDYGNNYLVPFHDSQSEIRSTNGTILAKRKKEVEKNCEADLLETNFIRKKMESSHYYCPLDKVAKSLTFLLELGWHIQDWKGQKIIKHSSADLSMDVHQDCLTIVGKIKYAEHEVDLANVLGVFNRKERFIQLGNNSVGLLPNHWEEKEVQEIMDEGEVIGQEIQIKKSHIGSLSSLFNQVQLPPALIGLKERLSNFNEIKEAKPSEHFVGILRPYQQQGLNWLSFLIEYGFHGILADDMGLGKTVQILALLSRHTQKGPHLIVMPTSLLFNWKNEIKTFLLSVQPYIHHGPNRLKSVEEIAKFPIILVSYTTLRLDLTIFQQLQFASVILDEAQMIKNAHTEIAQAVCILKSDFRLSITGTPIENHLNELWSHFRFLIPDLFGDEESFAAELLAAESDARYLQKIKKKIAPFILRRRKEEVAKDLPERVDQTVWVEMSDPQRKIYDQFLSGFRGNLLQKVNQDGISKHRLEVFEAILRLRQICCHPLLVSHIDTEFSDLSSTKFDFLFQDLETIVDEGKKVLIYSQFTSMLQLMAKESNKRKWNHAYLDGSTLNREKVITSFQTDPDIQLFFISLKAGGVGLNLTAADYVFLYDPWWNEAVEEQAINRAHRIGRKESVITKRIVTQESIEEKMMRLKSTKRLLIEGMLDETLGIEGNFKLDSEDFNFLLS